MQGSKAPDNPIPDLTGGYGDFVAEFYDFVIPHRERRDIDFYVELGQAAAGPVLELGCGTGRVLLPLARAGVEICGLDLSQAMLAVCVERLAREPEPVRSCARLTFGDIRRFDLGRKFRLITVPFRVFQHLLTVKDQLLCLDCISSHLLPGDRLVLDLFNPSLEALVDESRLDIFDTEPEFEMPDGRRVLRRHRIARRDNAEQIMDCELIYDITNPNGEQENLLHEFRLRWLYRFEVEHLLARAGFEIEAIYGDYDKSAFGVNNPGEQIFVARKI